MRDSPLCLDVKNPLSDYEVREKIILDPSQYIESEEGDREPPCHFALRWEGNKKRSVMEVLNEDQTKTALKKKNKQSELPRDLTENDSGSFVPVLALECRGLEPYAFRPHGGEFSVMSLGGMEFSPESIDLSEGDWADYDEENGISVSITDFQSKFVAV
jgi:hypothetical protein